MKYQPAKREVDAVKLIKDIFHGYDDPYRNEHRTYIARKGDWLVVDEATGEQIFMEHAEFIRKYSGVIF